MLKRDSKHRQIEIKNYTKTESDGANRCFEKWNEW